jgi:hypothetical protein
VSGEVIRPTVPVRVGKAIHEVARRSKVAHVNEGGEAMAYVLTAGRVHCFIEAGEVRIPERLEALVKTRVFGVE